VKLNSGIRHYKCKVVVSGDIIEIYRYERGIFKGKVNECGRAGYGFITDEQRTKNREVSLMRARRDLRRIVNANMGKWGDDVTCKFVTLTFRDNVKDLDMANQEFMRFIKRLNYKVYSKKCSHLKYTTVVEFQKRGAVHYHVVFYNLPFTKADVIKEVWGNGFIKVNKIDDVDNVGAYVCKYLTKDNSDDRLRGRRSYFNSRGLKKPIEEFLDDEGLEIIKKSLPGQAMTHEEVFDNEYVGKIEYEQYNLNRIAINSIT
jgi:hypothetical protein